MPLVLLFVPKELLSQNDFSTKADRFADSLFIKNLNLTNSQSYIDSILYYASKVKTDKQFAYNYSSIAFFFNHIHAYDKSLYYFEKSNEYAKNIDNEYILHSNYYGVSLIYFQLGNIKKSQKYLEKCYTYFTKNQKNQSNKLALINTLDRLVFIELVNNNLSKAREYNNLEYNYSQDSIILKYFPKIQSYSTKNNGIILYKEKKYKESIEQLNKAVKDLIKLNSNYWLSITYSYLGDNYLALKNEEEAYKYYTKVDSIYKEKKATDPFLRHSLEKISLLNKKNHSIKKQLESVNTLIQFDSLYNSRNTYLANKFYDEFIENELHKERTTLENKIITKDRSNILILIVLVLAVIGSLIFYFRNKRKQKTSKLKFQQIIENYKSEIQKYKIERKFIDNKINKKIKPTVKTTSEINIDENTVNEILYNLDRLETENYFIDVDITLKSTADKIGTNTNYLSYVINSKKGINFPTYINGIRINYIVKEIIENKRIRLLSMDGLANTAGFKTRQKFSDAFLEKTGVRPSYFIANIDKVNICNLP